MASGYVHDVDPILATVGGVHLWWYGLGFALGFANILLWTWRRRGELGFSVSTAYALALHVALGVLVGGRMVEVVFYEWPFYGRHPALVPAVWIGGMATHGLLFGGLAGLLIFCARYRQGFLAMADLLSVPAAFILGMGRIGNFIDGQIVGSPTDVAWAVRFPDAEGFRHPVVLYDGLKNFLLIPVLIAVARRRPPPGVLAGVFLLLYAGLRIPIDFFREYRTTLFGLPPGQELNLALSLAGAGLLVWSLRRAPPPADPRGAALAAAERPLWWRRAAFALLLLFTLVIPSDWTQDVPGRYGKRHPGLVHSALYPALGDAAAPR